MAVYVDNFRASYRGMKMSHMMADSTDELLAMASMIGLSHRYIQKPGTPHEHFDVSLAKRALAISLGALPVSCTDLGRLIKAKRAAMAPPT